MAETAATALGIAGAASVLQSLLQCYKDFLVARDFGRDYETRVLRLDLLQLSVKNWGVAVGLIDDSGAPQQRFRVSQPTEENVKAIRRALDHVKKLFDDAGKALDEYQKNPPITLKLRANQRDNLAAIEDNTSWKIVSRKIHRTIHREHDQQHPGTLKRGQWALFDKAKVDELVNDITALVDRLQSDFPPVDKKQQLDLLHTEILKMELTGEELLVLKNIAKLTDTRFADVADTIAKEQRTSHSFKNFDTSSSSTAVVGDFIADGHQVRGKGSEYDDIRTTRGSFTMAGNTYGGKSPLEIFMEKRKQASMVGSDEYVLHSSS